MATDVAAPLPDLTLMPGSTITVTDANGVALVARLVVKMFQVVPDEPPRSTPILLRRGGV